MLQYTQQIKRGFNMLDWLFGKKNKKDEIDDAFSEFLDGCCDDESVTDDISDDELADFLTSSNWAPQDFAHDGIEGGLSHINFNADEISFAQEVCEVMVRASYKDMYTLEGGFDFDRCIYEVRVKDESDNDYILKEPAKNRIQFEIELRRAVEQIRSLL